MAAVLAAVLVLLAACGDDGDDSAAALPIVEQIAPAVAAVEDELGGPQEYFEINATNRLVNLFVATDDAATATTYVYLDGELVAPAPAREASGHTFRADALTFDERAMFDALVDELDEPTVSEFVVIGGPDGAVQYEATILSERGGALIVVLGPDGTVLTVNPT